MWIAPHPLLIALLTTTGLITWRAHLRPSVGDDVAPTSLTQGRVQGKVLLVLRGRVALRLCCTWA